VLGVDVDALGLRRDGAVVVPLGIEVLDQMIPAMPLPYDLGVVRPDGA